MLNERFVWLFVFSVHAKAIPASFDHINGTWNHGKWFFSRFIHAIQTIFSIQFRVSLALKFSIYLLFTFGYVWLFVVHSSATDPFEC